MRPRLAGLALLLALVLAAPSLRAAGRPAVALGKDRLLVVSALPGILTEPSVKPHLSTGLTTSLVVEVTASDGRGSKVRGGGKIDVRYELWDEVFLVTRTDAAGRGRRESLPSFERLEEWWRKLEIAALSTAGLDPGGNWDVKVRVSVIPFSQSEQREAQRWFSDSIGEARREESAEPGEVPVESPDRLSEALDLLIATSIKRRSIASYAWTVPFRPVQR
jgi:hypothetical protein